MSSLLKIISSGEKKQKKYGFQYLSKKEFKKLKKENENVKVIGSTKLKEVSQEDMNEVDTYLFHNGNEVEYFQITKPKKGWKRGYICVGDDKYISYNRFGLGVLIPFFGGLCGILLVCYILGSNHDGVIELEDFVPIDLSGDVSQVEIKTYDFQTQGSYQISSENTRIKVWNPETNTRIFQYDVYIDGELVGQTKGISPGNMMEVECNSFLDKKGDHGLVLDLSVLDEETGEVVGQAQRNAVLTVE